MVAVMVHTVSPTGVKGFGWRPSTIAKHPVIKLAHEVKNPTLAPYCVVKFNVIVWG